MQIYKEMPLKTGVIDFDVVLPGRVCQVGGDSAAGKILFLRTLKNQVAVLA